MKNKIKDKVVVITGASRGIGLAMAEEISRQGGIVYDISRTIQPHQCMKKSFACDVNDTDKMAEILQEIAKNEGKIDVFINNYHL